MQDQHQAKKGIRLDLDRCAQLLHKVWQEACADPHHVAVPELREALETLQRSRSGSIREALLGCALAGCVHPEVDLRRPYLNLGERAFSGRTLDERVVNPFLQAEDVPCTKGPYLAMFRRQAVFDTSYLNKARDKAAMRAFLQCLDELERADAARRRAILVDVARMFVRLRDESNIRLLQLPRPSASTLARLMHEMLGQRSGGRVALWGVAAAWQAMADAFGLGWDVRVQGINVADVPSGAVADVEVRTRDEELVMALEVTERCVDAERLRATFRSKIAPNGLRDYLFLHGGGEPDGKVLELLERMLVQGHAVEMHDLMDWLHACWVSIGGKGRERFVHHFCAYLADRDTPSTLKIAWNRAVERLLSG